MNRTYVDVHILQTVPPSNLNRDDAGSPKQAIYGGVRRARVSSQAWKRATRLAFSDRLNLPTEQLGIRTKRIGQQLTDRITIRTGLDPQAARRLADAMLAGLGLTASKKKAEESAYLLFYGRAQLDRLVDLVADNADDLVALADEPLTKATAELGVQQVLTEGHPIDVALFGRMVADLTALNVDAATQVAHAVSTHEASFEFDYFTAVDDAKDRETEDAGAGMIGTVEFTSATLYRFATVGMHQLIENLDGRVDAAVDALAAFLEAFVYSMPTGHANTFAHHTLPNLVSVVVRGDQPVNLVSAFENPVRLPSPYASETRPRDGIAAESARRLDAELAKAARLWGVTPLLATSLYDQQAVPEPAALGPVQPFADIVAAVRDTVTARITENVPA
ncbi:type I-E CRISPR-associated protein Cas7/Cse4/CasC [Dactylosporangium sp. NPDC048998]|uniref:type I-E CRISPR-associated protein Cas7/Cse4/CasC n=1 Tax=Dactylosporangium sp. NPDC048998 TaxID=3363976 RepID=UPI0037226463